MMALFKYGANFEIVGKTDPQKLSYPGCWQTVEGTFADLAAHHGKGHPCIPALPGGDGTRKQSNCNYAEILGVDVDHGMTIQEAIANPFLKHCGLAIESSSSTPEQPKFRLFFLLSEPVTDWQTIRICNRYLAYLIKVADPACKDASRFYFGGLGRKPFILNESAKLPETFVPDALAWHEELEANARKEAEEQHAKWLEYRAERGETALDDVAEALDSIRPYTPGEGRYESLLLAIAGVLNTLGSDGERLLISWDGGRGQWGMPFDRKLQRIAKSANQKATLGSLFYLARQEGWKPSKAQRKVQKQVSNKRKREERLQAWENKLGSLPKGGTESRREINARLAAGQLLQQSEFEIGEFPLLSLPDYRHLFVLDGQKATRKTSKAIKSLVTEAREKNKTVLITVPTRVLSRSAAAVLEAACYLDDDAATAPIVVCCPESLWKFADRQWDVVILDEANEDIHRVIAGTLGNRPKQSRDALVKMLKATECVVLSQDSIYTPVLNAVQRHGRFNAGQVEIIRRRRDVTSMTIKLYMGQEGTEERWDGLEDQRPGQKDTAFYGWLDTLIQAVANGKKVSVPGGSQKRLREIARLLKQLFPEKKIDVFDGKDSFPKRRAAFAKSADKWIIAAKTDVLLFTPCFNSGVSIECNYFTAQFEYVTAFEQASNASQRGERVRPAIGGGLIEERHVYISQHGLSTDPDPEIFTSEYWRSQLRGEATISLKGARAVAEQLGSGHLISKKLEQAGDEVNDFFELADILAIHAREIYFKAECLEQEWLGNGWTVQQGDHASKETCDRLGQQLKDVAEGILQQRARCHGKAKPVNLGKDAEPSGPIEAIKSIKFSVGQIVGQQYPALNSPDFWAAWHLDPGSGGGLGALQLRALLQMQIVQPELWAEIQRRNVLRLIAGDRPTEQELGELPISPKLIATARLIGGCPGVISVLTGELQDWDKSSPEVIAAAKWARTHARNLAAVSRHSQRIHGLQFKESTPDIKCFHKLLAIVGIEAQCNGRDSSGSRNWQYRPKTVADIEAAIAKHEEVNPQTQRELYRTQTAQEITEQILQSVQMCPQLKNFIPSTTSVDRSSITEVLDEPPHEAIHTPWLAPDTIEDIREIWQSVSHDPSALVELLEHCPREALAIALAS